VETDALDKTTITTAARVSDDDVEERTIFSTATGKTNYDHFSKPSKNRLRKSRTFYTESPAAGKRCSHN
jgi:hypothetical protein